MAIVATLWIAGDAWTRGFPVDDAWIHMVYGLSVRLHASFDYNDGHVGAGATSPLWVLFAALAHLIAGAREASTGAALCLKLLGTLCHAGAAALSARLARVIAPAKSLEMPLATGAALIVGACPFLAYAAASGMEVALTSALLVGAIAAGGRKRPLTTAVVAGLAILARPEAAVAAPLAIALAFRDAPLRASWRRLVAAVSVTVALPGVWTVRNLVETGRALPATVYLKGSGRPPLGPLLHNLRLAFFEMLGKSRPMNHGVVWLLVAVAVVLGSLALVRRVRDGRWGLHDEGALVGGVAALAGLLYAGGLSAYTRFMNPALFYFQRYLVPVLPLVLVAALGAVAHVAVRVLRGEARLRAVGAALLALGGLVVAWEVDAWHARRTRYEDDVAGIDSIQVAMGRLLARLLPADAIVWSCDAGALRYFGGRRIVDIVRLNTPELFLSNAQVAPGWEPDAIVVALHELYLAKGPDGRFLPTIAEAPAGWDTGPGSFPFQTLVLCPPGSSAQVLHTGKVVAWGACRSEHDRGEYVDAARGQ